MSYKPSDKPSHTRGHSEGMLLGADLNLVRAAQRRCRALIRVAWLAVAGVTAVLFIAGLPA